MRADISAHGLTLSLDLMGHNLFPLLFFGGFLFGLAFPAAMVLIRAVSLAVCTILDHIMSNA